MADFFFLKDPESLAGEVGAEDVLGIKYVAEFFFGEAVEFGEKRVEFGAEAGAALLVPLERWKGAGAPVGIVRIQGIDELKPFKGGYVFVASGFAGGGL